MIEYIVARYDTLCITISLNDFQKIERVNIIEHFEPTEERKKKKQEGKIISIIEDKRTIII